MAETVLPGPAAPVRAAAPFIKPEHRTMGAPLRPRTCGGAGQAAMAGPNPFRERLATPALTPHLPSAAPAIYAAAEHLLDAGAWFDDGTFVYVPPRAADGAQDPDRCALVALQRALRHARLGPTRPYCPPPAARGPGPWMAALLKAGEFVGTCLGLGALAWAVVILARWLQAAGAL